MKMKNEKEILEFKKQLGKNLNEKFPTFEDQWDNVVKTLGNNFVGVVRDKFKDELQLFKEISKFRFSIVIDNNFIFGQIKNVVEKNKKIESSFVYRLINSNYIDIYGPYKLREELYNKIENILTVNNEVAAEYADMLLEKIIIKDAYWIDEWKKANNLIGHIDQDDVPYLALAFHTESHAIISNDKIFKKQGLSKSWNIQDADNVITSYNSGFISFCFIGTGMKILEIIWKTIISIFKVIGDLLLEIITVVGMLVVGAVDFIVEKIPTWLSLSVLASIGIAAIFSEDFRNLGKDILKKTGNIAHKVIIKIEEFIKWLINMLKDFWEIFKPVGITGLELAGYFSLEYELMNIQVKKLDSERAK